MKYIQRIVINIFKEQTESKPQHINYDVRYMYYCNKYLQRTNRKQTTTMEIASKFSYEL